MFRSTTFSDFLLTGALRPGFWLQLVNEKSNSFLYHVELFLWYHLWLDRSPQTGKGFQMILLMWALESDLKTNLSFPSVQIKDMRLETSLIMCGLVMFKKSEAASTMGSTVSFKIVKLRMASIWDISTMTWPLSQLVLSKLVFFVCLPPGGV